MDALDGAMTHVQSRREEWDSTRCHHATQNRVQFTTYELLFLDFPLNVFGP